MQLLKRIKEWRYTWTAAAYAAAFAAGYFLTGTKVAGIASFADISAAGAVGLPYSAAVFTGGLIRSILDGAVGHNIVKLSSLAIIVIIKMFLEPKNDPKLSGINTAAAVFLSGAAVSAVIGELLHKLIFYAFYGGIAGFTAYSAARAAAGLRRKRVLDLSGAGGFSASVVYIVIIASLSSVRLPVVNLGMILGGAMTLMGAYFYRRNGGVICGALTVCGAFLSSSSSGLRMVMLPAAGMLTGYMHRQKPRTAAGFFTGISFVMTVLTGNGAGSAEAMIDIICSALIFIPISSVFSDKWIATESEELTILSDVINTRMGFLSDMVGELRCESERIADMLADRSGISREIEENAEQVCSACYRRPFCWISDRGNTYRGFRKLGEMTAFSKELFPEELSECLRKGELADAFEKSARDKAAAKLMEMRFSESRELLHEQMMVTEELVRSAGERIDVRYSETVSRSIRERLERAGIVPKNVIACYNKRERMTAELYFEAGSAPESGRICDMLSDGLHMKLESTEPVMNGKEIRIRVYEKPKYTMEVCIASASADGAPENGDTCTSFTDGEGMGYVVLSDGMGTGRRASAESRMVAGSFRRLVTGGVELCSAIKMINSVMVTKSRDESFATLDAVRIDLDECRLTVIKSGAAATLIRHGGGILKVASPTFPIGIYEQSEVFVKDYGFDEGDIVVMCSDGISENAYPFIKELLLGGEDLSHIVNEICKKAEIFNHDIRSDDVTVIGVRVMG